MDEIDRKEVEEVANKERIAKKIERLKKQSEKDNDDFLPADEVIGSTAEALKKHPNVFDLKVIADDYKFSIGGGKHQFITGDKLLLKIDLPERFQKYADSFTRPVIEKFDVVASGSSFGAFAPVEDINSGSYIGHEYREIVKNQINKEADFFSNTIGPCPIHPNIYIVKLAKAEGVTTTEILSRDEDIVIVVDSSVATQEFVKDLLGIIDMSLIDFYRLMAIRSELLSYNHVLDSLFQTLSQNIINRFNAPWYRFLERRKKTQESRSSLTLSYVTFVKYEETVLYHARKREEFKRDLAEDPIAGKLSNYFVQHSENDSDLPSSIKSAIAHFENELNLSSNLTVVMIASILGATLGSILTVILTYYLLNK